MKEAVVAGVIAVAVILVLGPFFIPFLGRLKFGQNVRDDGPQSHIKKTGTPTMGGILFFFSISLATLFSVGVTPVTQVLLATTFGFGLIGFIDDYTKIVMKRSLGLKAKEKILGQILLSTILAIIAVTYLDRGTAINIPLLNWDLHLGWFYIPFVVIVVVGTSNSVNLTDGLDGLASGVTLFATLAFALISYQQNNFDALVFSSALMGTCVGFLFFNIHPAKVFMGDTGSLALGGAIGALAVITKTELILPIIGGVFVIEALSVILQVISFKLTGKRIFKMSPLHHHFELLGWSENRVVITFWCSAAIFAAIGWSLV